MFWKFLHFFSTSQQNGHIKEPQESNLFLIFFLRLKNPSKFRHEHWCAIPNCQPHRTDENRKKSDGWHLKATAIKQLKVGWIVGLFLFHLNGWSERHSLLQGGDQVKLDASSGSTSRMVCLLSHSLWFLIQFNCFLYSNFHTGFILTLPAPNKKKYFSFLHYHSLL